MDPAAPRRRPRPGVVAAVLAVACLGAFQLLDFVAAGSPGDDGHALRMTTLVSWDAPSQIPVLSEWDEGFAGNPWRFVVAHLIVDSVFIVAYTTLLLLAARRWFAWSRGARGVFLASVIALLVAEAIEMVLLTDTASALHVAAAGGVFPPDLADRLAAFEPLKFVPVGAVVLELLLGVAISTALAQRHSRELRK